MIVRSQSPATSSSTSSDTEEDLNVSVKNKIKARQKSKNLGDNTDKALKEIQPIELDGSVRFSSVGGLEGHIRCLREMVLFPLMYPQLFEKFGTQPPRGVLFHGPPGTGKTLLARALANECSLQGGQKVSFFMRKGADCLKKYVGESERNIKLLFQQATKMKPSIIFFDEIDALAPVRSVRQEQVHTSVVGTLLAEMDGMCDRGSVVVIGATNRLDAVDPALRRAGRLDRELHFPAPAAAQRADILRVHTRHWRPPPSDALIKHVAEITTGYGGSDLKALCSESVLRALERTYPQVYKTPYALLIDPQKVEVLVEDMVGAMRTLVAAGARVAPPPARALSPHLRPLLSSALDQALASATRLFSLADKKNTSTSSGSVYNQQASAGLLLLGEGATSHVGPALLSCLEHCSLKEVSLSSLHQGVCLTPEQALLTIFAEVRRAGMGGRGCVVYAPSMELLWRTLGESGAALLLHQWQEAAANASCLLLATADCPYHDLPEQIQCLFPPYKDCVYRVKGPSTAQVSSFLSPLFTSKPFEPPVVVKELPDTELPKAPPIPPPAPSPEDERKRTRREAHLLRELRIFLRDVCRKLAANRRFYKFTKPVDLEEVTDYLDIIKQPMDLETMMTKVDLHRYNCARDFLKDIDLICANALEYNPDRTSSDKQIRHEACSLRDHAHALVEAEMDSDFEDECRTIADRRVSEGLPLDKDLPNFIYTANITVDHGAMSATSCNTISPQTAESVPETSRAEVGEDNLAASRKRKRRKKCSLWSKGIAKKQKPSGSVKDANNPIITDEESKENKPLYSSPILEEESAKAPSPTTVPTSATPTSPVTRGDSAVGTVKKLQLDDVEMLFDGNTVDVSSSKVLDSHLSPGRHKDRRGSNMLTSTPHRKKSSSLEHSTHDAGKVIINRSELDAVFTKCMKGLRDMELKPLLELYSRLDRVVGKYTSRLDRTALPAEMQSAADDFIRVLSHK